MTITYTPRKIDILVADRVFASLYVLFPRWSFLDVDEFRRDAIKKFPKLKDVEFKLIKA